MQISENFTMEEFSVSARFPKLATGVPAEFQDEITALVLNVLQPLRTATGWRCEVTSGYRSATLNKVVGGADNSQHRKGEAADTRWFDKKGKQVPTINVLIKAVELRLMFDQMIAYDAFVHFSHTKKRANRKQVLYNKSYKGKKL